MCKLFVTCLLVGFSLAWRVQGQPRGDSIFGTSGTTPETNVLASLAAATTNSASSSRTNSVADGALIGFNKLAGFAITITEDQFFNTNSAKADAEINAMIPKDICALDQRNVSVEGFMMPVQFENGKTAEFILVQAPFGCCFGTPPQIHELIKVRVKPPGVRPIDGPARARGVMHVGVERQNGYLACIYRLDAESIAAKPQN